MFCMTAENDARVSRLAETMENVEKRSILKFELGVVTIVGQKMLKATYNIEGDSCCALITYDIVQDCSDWLTDHYENMTFPGVRGEIKSCVDTMLDGKETFLKMDRPKLLNSMVPTVPFFPGLCLGYRPAKYECITA